MLLTIQRLAICLFAAATASHAIADGPFHLLSRSFMSDACDTCCDEAGCDLSSCFDTECDACCGAKDDCDSVCCDTGCDAGCSSSCCDSICSSKCCCPKRYCSFFSGWNDLDSYSGESPLPAVLDGTFNDGWLFGIAAGREIHKHYRAELEFAFRSNTADQWTVAAVPGDWSGHLFTYSGMANLFRDLNECEVLGITPYVGAGLGFAIMDGEFQTAAIPVNVDETSFAWQAMAGGSCNLTDGIDLFTEYRYFAAEFNVFDVSGAPQVDLGRHDGQHQSIFFGVRFAR